MLSKETGNKAACLRMQHITCNDGFEPRNLKGESVVAAIYLVITYMEVNYKLIVPPDFFVAKPAKQFR